jgi:hypothetical protein
MSPFPTPSPARHAEQLTTGWYRPSTTRPIRPPRRSHRLAASEPASPLLLSVSCRNDHARAPQDGGSLSMSDGRDPDTSSPLVSGAVPAPRERRGSAVIDSGEGFGAVLAASAGLCVASVGEGRPIIRRGWRRWRGAR